MNDKQIYNQIRRIVLDVLESEGMFIKEWHHGKVDVVTSPTHLKVFVDGSEMSQTISCNPDVTFTVGDEVWVLYINGNPRDKHVISKRAI